MLYGIERGGCLYLLYWPASLSHVSIVVGLVTLLNGFIVYFGAVLIEFIFRIIYTDVKRRSAEFEEKKVRLLTERMLWILQFMSYEHIEFGLLMKNLNLNMKNGKVKSKLPSCFYLIYLVYDSSN